MAEWKTEYRLIVDEVADVDQDILKLIKERVQDRMLEVLNCSLELSALSPGWCMPHRNLLTGGSGEEWQRPMTVEWYAVEEPIECPEWPVRERVECESSN